MRIGILADVHANADALQAALADGEGRVDRWWFLGDGVGRGPAPEVSLDLLRQHVDTRHWLVGNHDAYIAGLFPTGDAAASDLRVWDDHRQRLEVYRPYRRRIRLGEWCRRAWRIGRVEPRPITTQKVDCWLVHAALGNRRFNVGDLPASYIFPWHDIEQRVRRAQQFEQLRVMRQQDRAVALIHGHTHVPYMAVRPWGRDNDVLWPIRYGEKQRLDQFDAVLINPGSVGFPRNGDTLVHAAYGILDTEASTFEFCRAAYDSELTRLAMARSGYGISLIRQLEPNHEGNAFRKNDAICLEWQRTYRPQLWGWEPISPL